MSRMSVEERVKSVLVEYLADDTLIQQIDIDQDIKEQYDLDSLDMVEISLFLEDEFNIEFTIDQVESITTCRSLIDIVKEETKYE